MCAKPSPFVGLLSIFEKQQKCVDRECQNVGFAPGMYGQFAEVSLLRADTMCSKICAPAREACNKHDFTVAPCFSIGQTS